MLISPTIAKYRMPVIMQTCGLLLQYDMKTRMGKFPKAELLIQGHRWIANCHTEVGEHSIRCRALSKVVRESGNAFILGLIISLAHGILPQTPVTHLSNSSQALP